MFQEQLLSRIHDQFLVCLAGILLLLAGCKPGSRGREDAIVVFGALDAPAGNYVYLYSFPDTAAVYGMEKAIMDSCIIDENGNFELIAPVGFPVAFDVSYGNDLLVSNLFACPGDVLEIYFTGEEHVPEVIDKNDVGKFNSFLVSLADSFYHDPVVKHEYYVTSNYLDGQQYEQYTGERRQQELNFFNNYFRDDSLRGEYREYALNTIEYGVAVDRLMYVWKKRMKGQSVVIDPSYFSFLTPAFVNNASGFNCPAYMRFLNLYIKETYERKLDTGELKPGPGMNVSVEKFKIAERLLPMPYRNAVIYNIVLGDMQGISGGDGGERNSLSLDSMIRYFKTKHAREFAL